MSFWRDLVTVIRSLAQARWSAGSIVLTLALALAANTAIFSAVHAVLLRPLPLAEPNRTVVVSQTDNLTGQAVIELTYRHLREWRGAGQTFTHSALVATHLWNAVLEERGEPTRMSFAGVSADFFEALGVRPVLGRGFDPADDVANAAPVIVLNYGAWQRRFGGDVSIVDRSVRLDGTAVRVAGVMPRGFDFPYGAEFWQPAAPILTGGGPKPNLGALDHVGVFYVIGRLRPGLDDQSAAREIDALEQRLDLAQPGRLKWGDRTVVSTFRGHVFGPVQPALWTLWAAVGVLLLIACANVSGLLVSRISARQRDYSLRLALGASRRQLARVWFIEISALTLTGGVLGLVAGMALTKALTALAPDDVPRVSDVAVTATVVAFTFGCMAVSALICGIIPIRLAGRMNITDVLNQGARDTEGRRSLRMRSVLLVAQVALAVIMLVAAGLVVRSFRNLRTLDLGFNPANVLSLQVEQQIPQPPPNQFTHRLLEHVVTVPGVEAAGAVFLRPLALGPIGQGVRVVLEGQPETSQGAAQNPTLNYQVATPGFFAAMQVPLRRGRLFDNRDTPGTPRVAIVGETTARRLWPGREAVGQRILMSAFTPGQKPQWRDIVGVVSDVRYRGLDEVQLDIYDPALQVGMPARTLVIRAHGDPLALVSLLRSRVREMDPGATMEDVTTMETVVARASAPWRMSMWLFVLFAGVAFALAAVGLFSLVTLDAAHRRRELAVRLALGATPQAVVRRMLAAAAWKAGLGATLGLAGAVVATRAMRALLYGVDPLDGATYVSVMVLVSAVVLIAAGLPALRAARTDPTTLMRTG